MLVSPGQLFNTQQPSVMPRVNRLSAVSNALTTRPAPQTFSQDQAHFQYQQQPSTHTDQYNHDETLPQAMIKEKLITKLLFAMKVPIQYFQKSDPDQIIDTGHKDKHGNPVRLTREAAAGFNNILTIAKSRGIDVKVTSSYRSVAKQEYLFNKALKKYGSERAARKWVAPPGKSRHNYGKAIDMHMYRNGKKVAQSEFDEIIAQAGMYRPMSWEGWHVEPLSTKGHRANGTHAHEHKH